MNGFLARSLGCLAALALLLAAGGPGKAELVYVGDDLGRVGVFNTDTNVATPLGNLSGFQIGQVLGLAYDPLSNLVWITDRTAPGGTSRVYTMDGTTGAAALAFTLNNVGFQGGAIKGNLLYGLNENAQRVEAYTLTGVNQLTGPALVPGHFHATGINPDDGQLFTSDVLTNRILRVNDDGTLGSLVVTSLANDLDDLDWFRGNFLGTQFGAGTVVQIDGNTGASSVFLTAAQTAAMGLGSGITGVAVAGPPIPEPASLTLFGVAFGGLLGHGWRRRQLTA